MQLESIKRSDYGKSKQESYIKQAVWVAPVSLVVEVRPRDAVQFEWVFCCLLMSAVRPRMEVLIRQLAHLDDRLPVVSEQVARLKVHRGRSRTYHPEEMERSTRRWSTQQITWTKDDPFHPELVLGAWAPAVTAAACSLYNVLEQAGVVWGSQDANCAHRRTGHATEAAKQVERSHLTRGQSPG